MQLGDTVGLVAPASPPPDPRTLDRAVAAIEKLGFKVTLGANVRKRSGFLAGTDRERAADLMRMFADPRVKAILCVRGGYGAARLLPRLDYRLIHQHPKIFAGYSDITALHCALLTQAGMVSFHGPMLNADFANKNLPEYTLQAFLRTVMLPAAPGSILKGCQHEKITILRPGRVTGQLIGGNLSVLCTTLGTPWQPPFRNRILFLEDLNEAPYRFDRMLTHLWNCGLLQQVVGVAIGVNRGCEDSQTGRAGEYRQSLSDVLKERLLPLRVPVIAGLPFGHVPLNATLPIGVRALLDADNGDLVLQEAAVR